MASALTSTAQLKGWQESQQVVEVLKEVPRSGETPGGRAWRRVRIQRSPGMWFTNIFFL